MIARPVQSEATETAGALRRRLALWFPTEHYPDPLSRFRAYCSYGLGILIAVTTISLVPATSLLIGNRAGSEGLATELIVAQLISGLCALLSIILVRSGYQRAGSWLTVIAVELNILLAFSILPPLINGPFLFVLVSIFSFMAVQALLLRGRDVPVIVAFTIINVLLATARFGNLTADGAASFAIFMIVASLAASVTTALLVRVQAVASGQIGIVLSREQRFIQAGQTVAQVAARTLDPVPFMAEVGPIIRRVLPDIDRVQIWQIDSAPRRGTPTITLGYSSAGIEPDATPSVGFLSVLNQVADGGRSLHTQSGTGLLNGIADQILLPIRTADRLLGVLVIASTRANVILEEDQPLSQSIADQIGLVLDNARLRVEQRQLYTERQRLNDELHARQTQLERKAQETNIMDWQAYLGAREASQPAAFTLDLQSGQIESFADWTPTLEKAIQTGQPSDSMVMQAQVGRSVQAVALPLTVQGNVIGALEFEFAPGQTASPEQISILQQVVQETALAVENARLVEESQRAASREAIASAIGARLQNTISVESVLANAAQSLADVLHAPRVAIRLTNPTETAGREGRSDRREIGR